MNNISYAVTAVVMAACCGVYIKQKQTEKRKSLIFKALATFMAVICAAANAFCSQNTYSWLIVAAVTCCMTADVLLEILFEAGAALFGIAHICFIAAVILHNSIRWYTVGIALILMICFLTALGKYLPKMGKLLIPGIIYVLLLCSMAGCFISAAIQQPTMTSVTSAIGAAFFVLSDFALAKNALEEKKGIRRDVIVLTLYYAAVYLIAFQK